MKFAFEELTYYYEVCRLPEAAMLKTFYEFREEVKLFMEITEKISPELSNKDSVGDFFGIK